MRAAAAGSFAHAYGKLISLLMHKLACIFGQSASTARLTTSLRLQDEITLNVVDAIEPSLRQAEIKRVERPATSPRMI